ncbi:MAG: peptide chain release factor N(5)-glutamine methyltransferase [Thiotrichaceae bacterium]|nr:peptide chain release factor N(5)-glutamine methyltransferase [Thiotrichaceae bacterium]PCI11306.1 MAG: protein-(glutamine-N5) methyltransferase, release factor-specific [Thiotrichales bacterium]
MTSIRDALNHAATTLATRHDGAMFEGEILLAHALEKTRTYLHTWPERALNEAQLTTFNRLVERRCNGEPSAYITGEQEFWSLSLAVTPDTLIPRPETELLVELALEHIPSDERYKIADLGTGSGAIALALASERPGSQIIAVDFSADALTVAECNREKHSLNNVTFMQGDWLAPLNELIFDVIVSNPPYVREDDIHLEQDGLPFEPRSALVASDNGLDDIQRIVVDSRARLTDSGWLLIEHGYDQGADVSEIFEQHGYHNITGHRDLSDQPRVVTAQYNAGTK